MKILPLAKIAAAKKRLIERTKEAAMPKIDVGVLEKQADAIAPEIYEEFMAEFARLIIEECAKACGQMLSMKEDDPACKIYDTALIDAAAAIRALKP